MTTAVRARPLPRRPVRTAPPARPGPDLALGLLPLAAVTGASCRVLGLPTSHLVEVGVLYGALATLILLTLPGLSRGPGLGPANRITLFRSTLVLPVIALVLHPGSLAGGGAWWVVGLATVALVLDGVDGRVARRTRSATGFGARFDMELDAALLMALSVLVWQTGRVESWVLWIGGLRYLFVAAGRFAPALNGDLPPSTRRKVVCVVQGVGLLVALAPVVPPGLAVLAAGTALVLLAWSFAVDVVWLVRAADRRAASA